MLDALSWGAILATFVGALLLISERGYRDGWRSAWFIAVLVVPAWLAVTFRSIRLDPTLAVAAATLGVALFRRFRGVRTTWTVSDILLAVLCLTFVVSDALTRTLIPGSLFELLRMWVLPYVLGRMFVGDGGEEQRSFPIVCVLVAGLSAFALIEAISQANVLARATGMHWPLLDTSEGFRWGLKRAQATTNHPIYFGLLLALVLPWTLVAARVALRGEGPRWWACVPVLAVAAAFATVSRSAQIAVLLVIASDLFFRRPTYRAPMVVAAVVGLALLLVFRTEAIDILGRYAGEDAPGTDIVLIHGEEYVYTGTRHRDLLMLAYDDAIEGAGWVGYGTNLRDMPTDPFMDPRFASIDNHYLLYMLRHGYLSVAAFLAFAAAAAVNLARVALRRDGLESDLAAGLCGAVVAVAILLRGVAFSGDFGTMWLFAAGLGAGWLTRPRPVSPEAAA